MLLDNLNLLFKVVLLFSLPAISLAYPNSVFLLCLFFLDETSSLGLWGLALWSGPLERKTVSSRGIGCSGHTASRSSVSTLTAHAFV